jgi:Lar family restriction alleviation protein
MLEKAPCPFCGKTELEVSSNGEDNYWVMCNTCGAEGPTAKENKVWMHWNYRVIHCSTCGKLRNSDCEHCDKLWCS